MNQLSWTIERRGDTALLIKDGGSRPATPEEVEAFLMLDPTEQFRDHLTERYSRGGSTICTKHDYIVAELLRISQKPQMVALRDTLDRMVQVARAAKRDGISIEKGLQRRGEECNNIEDAADTLARGVRATLLEAALAVQLRRGERLGVAESPRENESIRKVAACDVENMDRLTSRIEGALADLVPFIIEKEEEKP